MDITIEQYVYLIGCFGVQYCCIFYEFYITSCSRLNKLRSQLGGVQLILSDEISKVGSNMFIVQINNRFKDITGSKEVSV